jgi:hypothetical protein
MLGPAADETEFDIRNDTGIVPSAAIGGADSADSDIWLR